MRVLVVEDEADLASTLRRTLSEAHFAVDIAADGDEAQFMLREVSYDAVVLDLMVPKRSGWTLLQDLRQGRPDAAAASATPGSGARTPILILTALDGVDDRVKALDLGADDYLPKPFALSELVARLRALVRRAGGNPAPVLVVGDITIDRAARLVYREKVPVDLTAREYAILELMVRHRGTLVTRSAICEHIYSEASDVFSNVIDVHIAALRRKLGPTVIHTRRGQGYIVNA
jgi:two-component system OmpR family response regulator